jgi:hypothetical protein
VAAASILFWMLECGKYSRDFKIIGLKFHFIKRLKNEHPKFNRVCWGWMLPRKKTLLTSNSKKLALIFVIEMISIQVKVLTQKKKWSFFSLLFKNFARLSAFFKNLNFENIVRLLCLWHYFFTSIVQLLEFLLTREKLRNVRVWAKILKADRFDLFF